jgi:type II secretory pathway pseudopilin PulG
LIELLLVVLLLGMAAALAGPRLLALGPAMDLERSGRQVADVVRMAQTRAAQLGGPVRVRYDLREGTLGIVEAGWTEALPERVGMASVRIAGGAEARGGQADIVVFASGYVEPHEVELEAEDGGALLVRAQDLKVQAVR